MKQARPKQQSNTPQNPKQKASPVLQASEPLAPSSMRGEPFGRSRVAEKAPADALRTDQAAWPAKLGAWLKALLKK